MKMPQTPLKFTLIEVIITLVLVGFAAASMVSYMGRSITESKVPLNRLEETYNLEAYMEAVEAHYQTYYQTTDILGLQNDIAASFGKIPPNPELPNKVIENLPDNHEGGSSDSPYELIENHFIEFLGATDVPVNDPQNLLKVTIKHKSGKSITALFSVKL